MAPRQLRTSPSMRIRLAKFERFFPVQKMIENKKATHFHSSEIVQMIENHLVEVLNKQRDLKQTSEMYEYLHNTRFEVSHMVDALKLALCARNHFDFDVMLVCKGLLYSSLKQHPIEEQIEFAY